MIGAYFEQLRLLEMDEYIARQIGDNEKHKKIKSKIENLKKKIEEELKKGEK